MTTPLLHSVWMVSVFQTETLIHPNDAFISEPSKGALMDAASFGEFWLDWISSYRLRNEIHPVSTQIRYGNVWGDTQADDLLGRMFNFMHVQLAEYENLDIIPRRLPRSYQCDSVTERINAMSYMYMYVYMLLSQMSIVCFWIIGFLYHSGWKWYMLPPVSWQMLP